MLLVVAVAAAPVDEAVHDLVFRHVVSHEVRLLANGFTLLGTTWAGVGLLGTLVVVAVRTADRALRRASLGGLTGLAVGGLAAQVVKQIACRARPGLTEGWGVGAAEPIETDPVARGFFHWPCLGESRYHSFPSGHAATAFTVAGTLVAFAPAGRRAWLAVAAGVGVSRVLLNAHFLSDVFAGALIGWWAAAMGRRLVAWLGHRTAPSGPDAVERTA